MNTCKCKHCGSTFSSLSSLNNHIKTAKYCLSLRQTEEKTEEKVVFKCSKCSKSFTSKRWCLSHEKKCVKNMESLEDKVKQLENENIKHIERISKQNEQLEIYKNQIEKLQDKLENIALQAVKRPTTTNKTQINNFIQNMEPITQEHLVEYTPQLTLAHIQKGASGYAEYALEYPLRDRLVCVDYSRRKIKFKNKDGDLIADPEMAKLAPMFFESIKDKSSEIVYSQNDPNMD